MTSVFERLQSLGRALMLPIAVLPVAGLLLRLGQPDVFDQAFIAAAGDAIFSNLGLLFAIGVAVGLAKENNGAAGLAGVVCYLVATSGAKILIHVPPEALTGFTGAAVDLASEAFKNKAIAKLGVPTGIVSGLIAGSFYNRFHTIKLPEYLAFFAGRRFVPIAAGLAGLVLAGILGGGWAAISAGVDWFSLGVVKLGAFGLFLYGVFNRLLIVTGLHHILNNIAWFIVGDYHGATGDLKRFFAGDPSAGDFMSGFFPVMMFGLPAACLAMYHTVPAARRKAAGGALASMALTAFLTGVTEPIEFSFMFLAPLLYAIHAVLTGLSMVVMHLLGVKLGFSFSAGLFDYLLNYSRATRAWVLLPVGAVYAAVYYTVFRFAITRFNLKTFGREDDAPVVAAAPVSEERGRTFAQALGGAANLKSVDACTTRLRLIVVSQEAVDEQMLKRLGARGFVRPSANALQVVLGPIADQVAGEIRNELALARPVAGVEAKPEKAGLIPAVADNAGTAVLAERVIAALGGATEIAAVSLCASRVIVALKTGHRLDALALGQVGLRGVARLEGEVHLIAGPESAALAAGLAAKLGL